MVSLAAVTVYEDSNSRQQVLVILGDFLTK